jgi:hypothetical protein
MDHPVTRAILERLKLLAAEATDTTYEFHDYAATEMRDTLGKCGNTIFDLALKGLDVTTCSECGGSGHSLVKWRGDYDNGESEGPCGLCKGSGKSLSADERRLEINHITNQLDVAEHALQLARVKLGQFSRRTR